MKLSFIFITTSLILLQSCMKGESADLVIHNASIHTMEDGAKTFEAIAIKDGKIIEVGSERQILNKYSAEKYIDAAGKDVYPGFTDAHGHIMSYARQKLSVDLVGCKSYDEMLVRIEKYQSKHNRAFIIGRGWDQSRWKGDEMPTNNRLNELFPDIPVCLFRIDGHALLANDYLIKKSDVLKKFAEDEELNQGGYIITQQAKKKHNTSIANQIGSIAFDIVAPTGVFVDNAMNPILDILPDFPKEELNAAILEVQHELFTYGVTGVHEAGLKRFEVELLEELMENESLPLNIYAMLSPTEKNIEFARKEGIYQNKSMLIRSFKVYGDGAMGSRGAFMKEVYSDSHEHQGYLTTSLKRMKEIATICEKVNYQMNTHAIGDSTNRIMLELYQDIYSVKPDHRWRIEHAQIVDPKDFQLFAKAGVFPSVQPTHATSDQGWVESRVGKERMGGAYAYRSLLNQFGMMAIGTDFPVELTNPFATIHSAVNRKNTEEIPGNGFLANESITFEQCLKGMTIWAAFAAFQENELGTLEKGKDATLVIFERPVAAPKEYQYNFANTTIIKGKIVYTVE
ncbi:MAG: amidohydrolase [Fluviicola sp.]|nr:amidohydrolase [Fluviicola sp.]